jgi:CXXX repeat peptide maturase
MDKIKRLWILLSKNAVCCCNEPWNTSGAVPQTSDLDPDLMSELLAKAADREWQCTIVTDRTGVPDGLHQRLDPGKHRIVVPADYEGQTWGTMEVVFDCEQASRGGGPSQGKAILRASQGDLGRLGPCVIELLNRYAAVSIKHPDLLKYTQEDFQSYKEQLQTIGEWLLSKGASWSEFCIDVLTNGFGNQIQECGAGDTSLAVGPDGGLYFCPAAFRSGRDPCGHISRGAEIANRHLFTREYALPCRDKCGAVHCSRCVFLNKLATYEFCVPAENVCKLAHTELEVQAWLGKEAAQRNLWNAREGEWTIPRAPVIDDPLDLVKTADEIPDAVWQRLVTFTGRPEDLSPPMMLDIICHLRDRVKALSSCVAAGYVVPSDLLMNNLLLFLRRQTVEAYKEFVFEEGCPTVHETEMSMHRMVEVLAKRRSS